MQKATKIATVRNANNNDGKLTHDATQEGNTFGSATSFGDQHNINLNAVRGQFREIESSRCLITRIVCKV
jgi:hypothetical protein